MLSVVPSPSTQSPAMRLRCSSSVISASYEFRSELAYGEHFVRVPLNERVAQRPPKRRRLHFKNVARLGPKAGGGAESARAVIVDVDVAGPAEAWILEMVLLEV